MPGATLPNMSIVLPSLGGDSGIWDDEINAALTLLDAHDHTSGKGPRVPVSGLNINADIAFGGNGATGLGLAAFNARAALTTGARSLFVNSADNELYWRTNGGTNVKLTSGTSINTSLVGGIVGDYAAVGAEVAYDDAGDRYTFKQQGGSKPWARVACGGLRLFEFNTTEALYTAILANSGLGASYDITLPAALPGSQSLVVIDAAGAMAFTNTITSTLTLTQANVTTMGGTPTFSGAVTMNSTLGVGAVTSTGVVKGTDLGHTSARVGLVAAAAAESAGPTFATGGNKWTVGTSTARLVFPLPIVFQDTITAWRLYCNKASGSGTISARLYKSDTTGVETALGTLSSNAGASPGAVTLSNTSLTVTSNTGEYYYIVFTGGGTTGDEVYYVEYNYTRNI